MSAFHEAVTKLVDDYARSIARRKETMTVCAMVDKVPSLRWVEWRLGDGSSAHILISGGQGLNGRWVSGFRLHVP